MSKDLKEDLLRRTSVALYVTHVVDHVLASLFYTAYASVNICKIYVYMTH